MRKPTPTPILALRGAFETHPERLRARANEPKPNGAIGAAPRWMSAAQRACYKELCAKAHRGVLCRADEFVVSMAAILLEQMRRDPEMSAARLTRLQSLLSSLGMSPADRSRISATQGRADGPGPFDF